MNFEPGRSDPLPLTSLNWNRLHAKTAFDRLKKCWLANLLILKIHLLGTWVPPRYLVLLAATQVGTRTVVS